MTWDEVGMCLSFSAAWSIMGQSWTNSNQSLPPHSLLGIPLATMFTLVERTYNKKCIPNETSSFCSLHHPGIETITKRKLNLLRSQKARITLLRVSWEDNIRDTSWRKSSKFLVIHVSFFPVSIYLSVPIYSLARGINLILCIWSDLPTLNLHYFYHCILFLPNRHPVSALHLSQISRGVLMQKRSWGWRKEEWMEGHIYYLSKVSP